MESDHGRFQIVSLDGDGIKPAIEFGSPRRPRLSAGFPKHKRIAGRTNGIVLSLCDLSGVHLTYVRNPTSQRTFWGQSPKTDSV